MRPYRNRWRQIALLVPLTLAGCLLLPVRSAHAIPAFARKYRTSCTTCHTVYPKLNPFGEAFRRNGYRFPGADSDMVNEEPVSLGREAYKKMFPNAVWPGTLPGSVPLAIGANGQIVFLPQTDSGAGNAADNASVDMTHLVDEAHLWAGGTIGNSISYFGELTANGEEPIEVEHSLVQFDDLIGPPHAVNVAVGKTMPTLTSFGMHSTYLTDMAMPMTNEAVLVGLDGDGWMMVDNYATIELNGTAAGGRLDYSFGLNQGASDVVRAPRNVYGHVGYKLGGVRLDGEENSGVPDPMKPWAETALTLDAFAHYASTKFSDVEDRASVFGGALRGQWRSLELDTGGYYEVHDNGDAVATAKVLRHWDELSYVVYPWLVPALRLEYIRFAPDSGPAASDMAISAGVATLLRANLRAVLSMKMEHSSTPPAATGWDEMASADRKVGLEVETISLGLAYAY